MSHLAGWLILFTRTFLIVFYKRISKVIDFYRKEKKICQVSIKITFDEQRKIEVEILIFTDNKLRV